MKLLAQLRQQLNKRDKGSSLVTVLLVSSIVAILVTVVLAIVILNVYMKRADMLGQSAFYDAESALEEIRAGLALDESKATTEAYLDTLSNYANLDDEEKTDNFDDKFQDNLRKKLTIENGNYNISILESYLKETKFSNGVGAEILTSADDAHFNVTKEGAVLKNVHVKYTDSNNYVSEIKTDIVLEYPPVNFQNASSIDNILTYGLIANNSFKPSGTVNVVGNAYFKGEEKEKEEDIEKVENEINANVVNFKANGTQETNVISGGNIILKGTEINTDNVAFWSDNITLDSGAKFNMNSGSMYIKNDLVLGNNARSNLKGKLIMFGNPWVAISEQMIESPEVRQGAKDDMPSYSSSILVTGSNAGLDMSGLSTMVIGGSAYIDSRDQNSNRYRKNASGSYVRDSDGIRQGSNVVTGQSMMLTSDQRAYLVPSTLVGAEFKPVVENGQLVRMDNYSNGLTNPMTGEQYKRLIQEIMAAKGYTSESQVQPNDIVNFDLAEPTIGMSLNQFARAVGVTKDEDLPSVKPAFYQTNNGGSMVYLFLEFKTVGDNFTGQQNKSYIPAEAFYNLWYQLYHTTLTNYTRLLGNLNYYAAYGIKLPRDVGDKTRMYFTGNILSTETNPVIIPDIITQPDFTIDLNVEYSKQSAYYQDAYYTLNKNLSTRYATLSSAAKNNSLFDNLITKTATVGDKTYTLSGTNYYVSPSGEAAVVVGGSEVDNGDVTYNSSLENSVRNTKDNNGEKHSNAKVNLIIATGDVTVTEDFEGMIIAGGDVIVRSGNTITSNPDKAAKALIATAYNDGKDSNDCAANFVINAARYLLGGTGREDGDSGHITMKDYVTYRNWTKQ